MAVSWRSFINSCLQTLEFRIVNIKFATGEWQRSTIKMTKLEKIIVLWGVLDLVAIAYYIGRNIYYKRLPVIYDVQKIIENTTSFGLPELKYLVFASLLLYLSPLISGIYLIKLKKAGAIVNYIQIPFRLVMIIPPSLFFILWPLKYMFDSPPVILGIALVIFSETLKNAYVIRWHRMII